MEKLTPEEKELLFRLLRNELTPEERKGLRSGEDWENSLVAWLDSARPSVIREKLAGPRETFLTWMDSRAMALITAILMGKQEETEALAQVFPMWEEQLADMSGPDEDEEIDRERALELTPQERKALLAELRPDQD